MCRFLTLPTLPFVQNEVETVERSFIIYSESYVDALNGDIGNGQYQCTLASGMPFEVNQSYSLPGDIVSCSQVRKLWNQS